MSLASDIPGSGIDLRTVGVGLLIAFAVAPMAASGTSGPVAASEPAGGNLTGWAATTSSSPPSASFSYSPSTPNPDDRISLDASGSSDNGTIVEYEWDSNGDGYYSAGGDAGDGQTTSVTFDTGGTYTVRLKVTDDSGETDTVSKRITVENPAPTASFSYSPSTPNPDDRISLDASGSSDSDGTIEEYEWDTNGDGYYSAGGDAGDGQSTSVTFDEGGTYTVGLKVTDNGEKTTTTTKQITVDNPAPTASFSYSPSTPNPDDRISLDASASSDSDGTIEEYEWDTNGDGYYSAGGDAGDGQSTSVTFDTGGTYTVGLKVTDNGGKTTTTTKQITVDNPAPTASFSYSPSTPNPDDRISLDASGSSDSDGTIVEYEWDTSGDGYYSAGGDAGDGKTTSVTFDEGGTYTVGLKVTDNGGKTVTTTQQIIVENPAPTASFSYSPSTPNPDDRISLDASASSDSDGTIETFEWDTSGDGYYSAGGDAGDGQSTSVTFDTGGTYTVGLKVTDNGGKTTTTTKQITVENPAPTASFSYSPSTPNPDDRVTLDASGSSDSDGTITDYEWDTSGDGHYSAGGDAGDGQSTSVTFDEGGTYTVGLKVTDNGGKTATTTQRITVENKPPSASLSISPSAPKPDQEVRFDGSASSDPDGTLGTYIWLVDGQEIARGQSITHSFDTDGTKTVTLKVVDAGGKTATASKRVTVENTGPTASFTTTPSAPTPNDEVTFDASGSSDPDGTIEAFVWGVDGEAVGEGETFTYQFEERGEHTVTLAVRDNGGKTATSSATVSVSLAPEPSIAITPETIGQGNSVTFDAGESVDPDGDITEYVWRFDDGTTKRGVSVSRTFTSTGESKVTLTVVDDTGHRVEQSASFRVYEAPDASISVQPDNPIAGNAVELTASSADEIQRYRWEIDGETNYTGASTAHTFTESGEHRIVLYATNSVGVTSRFARTVSVDPDATFELTSNQGQLGVGETAVITFSVNNNIPDRSLEARLQLALPSTGVSIASVEGAEITSRSTTNFFTVDGGGQSSIRVRMRFNEPGTYEIGGQSIYFYGNQSNSREKSVDAVSISVADESQSQSDGSGPGFGLVHALGAVLSLLALARYRD